tara:strand:- start:61 stop:507 length:447 start_codon:yes stop_codon:yes gene_type:complete
MIYKIYRIIDNTNNNCYVGQTTREVKERINKHTSDFKIGKGFCSSKLILKNNDWKYELIEETDDITREKYWIKNSPNCINKFRLDASMNNGGIEKIREYWKNWRKENPENKEDRIKTNKKFNEWYKSWGGRRDSNNMSLLKISPDVFK